MLSNYPTGFEGGVAIRDRKYETTTGKVFWVGNSATLEVGEKGASNGNSGTYLKPFSTIDYAVEKTSAGRGDVIYVRPGYTQTITGTDITVDIAGISIIGLGSGSSMPTISHNHADAEVSITADNVTWQGFRHRADVTVVKVAIEIEDGADFCTVRGCKFDVVTTTTDEFLVTIRTNDASNNALIENNDIDMGLGGAVAAISFTKDTDGTTVRNNRIEGDFSTAVINGITTLSTKLDIQGNLLINGNAAALGTQPGIELLTGSTGTIRDNYIVCNLTTKAASVVADTCMLFENYYNEDISGAATGGIIGAASADD
jgi:hypothetical protein